MEESEGIKGGDDVEREKKIRGEGEGEAEWPTRKFRASCGSLWLTLPRCSFGFLSLTSSFASSTGHLDIGHLSQTALNSPNLSVQLSYCGMAAIQNAFHT